MSSQRPRSLAKSPLCGSAHPLSECETMDSNESTIQTLSSDHSTRHSARQTTKAKERNARNRWKKVVNVVRVTKQKQKGKCKQLVFHVCNQISFLVVIHQQPQSNCFDSKFSSFIKLLIVPSGKKSRFKYIKPSRASLNLGSILNTMIFAFCFMYFFNNTGTR